MTDLAPVPRSPAEVALTADNEERLELIKRMICPDGSDDELLLFTSTCRRLNLDPFCGQIHAVRRWDKTAKRKVMSIQVGIHGLRLVADRSGQRDGIDGPFWCGQDGKWSEVWLAKSFPAAAKVIVYRKGHRQPYTGVATWVSFAQYVGDTDRPTAMWAAKSDVMLAKCAEAEALRKAFPDLLSGVYIPEEMDNGTEINEDEVARCLAPTPGKPQTERKEEPPRRSLPPPKTQALEEWEPEATLDEEQLAKPKPPVHRKVRVYAPGDVYPEAETPPFWKAEPDRFIDPSIPTLSMDAPLVARDEWKNSTIAECIPWQSYVHDVVGRMSPDEVREKFTPFEQRWIRTALKLRAERIARRKAQNAKAAHSAA